MSSSIILSFFLINYFLCGIQSSKIMVVFPVPSHSHFSLGQRISQVLAQKNHEVTFINPFPQKTVIKNVREISVADNVASVEDLKKGLFDLNTVGPLGHLRNVHDMGLSLTEWTIKHKNMQDLLKSNETFDVVILEHFFNDALVGIADHFKAPLIVVSSGPPSILNDYLTANPAPSSYVPHLLGTFTEYQNFAERFKNFFYNTMSSIITELFYLPGQRTIFKKYFKTNLQLDDVLYNASLMFTNSHYSIHGAVPLVPNIVELAGIHIYPPNPLPNHLQEFLDNAKQGVVVFSLGSNLRSQDLKPQIREALLKSFSKIKQKVLWKFETDFPDAPPNVKIMQWLPQQDVLAHPHVQAFISHGGLLSIIETVYYGVPLVGIPVFGDQKNNIAAAVQNGYAVGVSLNELSEETFSEALNEVLNNPKYRKNVKQCSKLMKDRPLSPADAAVYWIEHVIKNRGAPHLRSPGLDLTWYQRYMVDIFAFLILCIITLCILSLIIIKKIIKLFYKNKKGTVTKVKKNK